MYIIPVVLLGCQIPICYKFYFSVLHLAPAVSASQLLQSGILFLYAPALRVCTSLTLFAITSRPTISSKPSNPLNVFLLRFRFNFGWSLCAFTTYVLTYLKQTSINRISSPAALRAVQSAGIQVTQRAILSFFDPQGRHVVSMGGGIWHGVVDRRSPPNVNINPKLRVFCPWKEIQ